jgi:hypothetical protein
MVGIWESIIISPAAMAFKSPVDLSVKKLMGSFLKCSPRVILSFSCSRVPEG